MPESTRALSRALLLILALSLAPVAASAATVRYWVPDNPWVQAMLAMMETLGLLQPAPPGYGAGYTPDAWSGGWPGSGFATPGLTGMPGRFGWPGMTPGMPDSGLPSWGAGNFWSPPDFASPGSRYGRPAGDGLAGLWVSPDGEALWLDQGGFAYRDASGRSLGGRMLRQGDRLLVEIQGGGVISMQYQLRGPYLQILDPQGLVRQFRRLR